MPVYFSKIDFWIGFEFHPNSWFWLKSKKLDLWLTLRSRSSTIVHPFLGTPPQSSKLSFINHPTLWLIHASNSVSTITKQKKMKFILQNFPFSYKHYLTCPHRFMETQVRDRKKKARYIYSWLKNLEGVRFCRLTGHMVSFLIVYITKQSNFVEGEKSRTRLGNEWGNWFRNMSEKKYEEMSIRAKSPSTVTYRCYMFSQFSVCLFFIPFSILLKYTCVIQDNLNNSFL